MSGTPHDPIPVQCRVSVAALRRDPDLVSCLDSQVLCGESADVVADTGEFLRVKLHHDGYTGWVESRQFRRLEPQDSPPAAPAFLTADYCGEAVCGDRRMRLVLGTPLPHFDGSRFRLGDEEWEWTGTAMAVAAPAGAGPVLTFAMRYLESPYFWGGRTPFGIDCSGFVQAALRPFGIAMARDTIDQIDQGRPVATLDDAVPGDLAFFGSPETPTRHVGIVCGRGEILHAAGNVHVDDLTDDGIRRRDTGELSHRLSRIRRVLPALSSPSATAAAGTSR